ncbi:MAG: ferredoxin family protein [Planctomycetota bacterium]
MPEQNQQAPDSVAELVVVISTGQSRNPQKRELENTIAESAGQLPGVKVLKIPHLYDLTPKGESFQLLQNLESDLVVVSWLYDRAVHWVLDRNDIRGQVGEVELQLENDEEDEPEAEDELAEDRVILAQPRPSRTIYCLDFRASENAAEFTDEIKRILGQDDIDRTPLTLEMLQRFEEPTNDTYVGAPAEASLSALPAAASLFGSQSVTSVDEHPGRRWYPVIDFSRCTNCMECIDFCLFGVYGVDAKETILVEQADNCRKGCPACSRVCPQNAIIFPQHKTPAIAGAPVDTGGLKIDLSKLFGAPESEEDAADVAARERDEQLILAGREAVGKGNLVEKRLSERAQDQPQAKNDDLDGLLDQLDALDL